MERTAQESLRPADVVVLLQVHLRSGESWTFNQLSQGLLVSTSRVHDSLARSARAHLYEPEDRRVLVRNLEQFLAHGVRFAFPATLGPVAQGVPTGAFAPPMSELLSAAGDPLVWPHVGPNSVKGQSLTPLHPRVPEIASQDDRMHELLALVDSLRVGGSRERRAAAKSLRARLK